MIEGRLSSEPLFPTFIEEDDNKINKFDFIFSNTGGNTTVDLIEVSGLERSQLLTIKKRINDISNSVKKESASNFDFKIENALTQILGKAEVEVEVDIKTGKSKIVFKNKTKSGTGFKPVPKYQAHLLKIIPLIYTENYHTDNILLPALIQNVEFSIRAGDPKYNILKYDLKFLLNIQNSQTDKFMEITNSESYLIGLKLGRLSKPLKKAINSFEKNYVGLLTRRVATKDDCIKFYTEINEKLVMHNKIWANSSAEIASELAGLPNSKYDKEKMAFGFFEGYFKYEAIDKKKDFYDRVEKLLNDYEGNETLEVEINQLSNLLKELKN